MSSSVIYGFHSISPVLYQTPELIATLYLEHKRQDRRVQEIIALATAANVAVATVSSQQLLKICGSSKHQGIAAELIQGTAAAANLSLKGLIDKLAGQERATIVVLDGITDPHNLGAIIRSCDCFGVAGVIVPKDNSASINATVAKVAAGALAQVPVVVVNNLVRALEQLKDAGYWSAGTSLAPNSVNLYEFKPDAKMVWVMGNEGTGIRRLVAETCDHLVAIPMYGSVQSLNVSVAAGVVLAYQRFCQFNS